MVCLIEFADTVSHTIRSYMPCRQAVLLTFPHDLSSSSLFFALLHQREGHLLFFQSPAHSLHVYPGWHQDRSPDLQAGQPSHLLTDVKSFRSNIYKKVGGRGTSACRALAHDWLQSRRLPAYRVASRSRYPSFPQPGGWTPATRGATLSAPSDRGRFPHRRRRIRRGMAWPALPPFPVLITSTGI